MPAQTITFEDRGQDFLEWDINDKGHVVTSRPFQAAHWRQYRVVNHTELVVGGKVQITNPRDKRGRISSVIYPIAAISTVQEQPA